MAQRDNFIEQIYYVNFRQSFPFNFLWEAALDNIVINYNKSGMLHSQKKKCHKSWQNPIKNSSVGC